MDFRDRAMQIAIDHNCRDLCEIGVWKGELADRLYHLAEERQGSLVLVDPWSILWNNYIQEDGERYTCTMNEAMKRQSELNQIHDGIRDRLPGALILRMTSHTAAEQVPDRSLDYIFLDGVHEYRYCLQDIRLWLPKLRPGGIFAGDDYRPEHSMLVATAVDEIFGKKQRDVVWWEKV